MIPKNFNRRDSLKSLAALGAAGTLGAFSEFALAQKPITVGVIYVGARDINAFTLGARSVKPGITTSVIFTDNGSMPVKEAEATNSLADKGVDVFAMHVDGPKVIVETAAKRGKMVCGYHASQTTLAPNACLTGAEWNWLMAYTAFVDAARLRRSAAGRLHRELLPVIQGGVRRNDARPGRHRWLDRHQRPAPACATTRLVVRFAKRLTE